MNDSVSIWLPEAKFTHSAGTSLAGTLYRQPLTIGLTGELGAGKTTFLQGFLKGLGVQSHVVSPTYALEQHYKTRLGEITHIDLYRLNEKQASELATQSDDHEGIRCIEWVERCPSLVPDIMISLSDKDAGRNLEVTFHDIALPSEEEILGWRNDVDLPEHICRHCEAVADMALKLAEHLSKQGILVRPLALKRAGQVHDLLRFVDFVPGGGHAGTDVDDSPKWEEIKAKYPDMRHEKACATFLSEHGYPELGDIVEVHGVRLPPGDNATIEQQLLYYADKRMMVDKVVSLEERFADFQARYGGTPLAEHGPVWIEQAQAIEQKLFPEGVPC